MFCGQCGKQQPENASFCLECGAPLIHPDNIAVENKPAPEAEKATVDEHVDVDVAAEAPVPKKKRSKVAVAAVVAGSLLLAGGGAFALAYYNGWIDLGGSGSATVQELLETAQRFLEQKKYEEAIIEFEKILELDPLNVETYIGLAEAYAALGNNEKAIEYLEKGFEKTEDDALQKMLEEYRAAASADEESAESADVDVTMEAEETVEVPEEMIDLGAEYGEEWVGTVLSDSDIEFRTVKIEPLTEAELNGFAAFTSGIVDFAYKVGDEYVLCVANCDKHEYVDAEFGKTVTAADLKNTSVRFFEHSRTIKKYTFDSETNSFVFKSQQFIAPEDMPAWWQSLREFAETLDEYMALELIDIDRNGAPELVAGKMTAYGNSYYYDNMIYDPDSENVIGTYQGELLYDLETDTVCLGSSEYDMYFNHMTEVQYYTESCYYETLDGEILYSYNSSKTEQYQNGTVVSEEITVSENGVTLSDEEARTARPDTGRFASISRTELLIYTSVEGTMAELYEMAYRCTIGENAAQAD